MDPEIWSRLPEELLDHVLSCLPLKTFLSLGSTCKHFKSLVFSPPFISKHSPDSSSDSSSSSSSPFSSFLLLSHPQFHCKCPLFDTSHNAWRNLPLTYSSILSCASSSTLLSISNGRLCFYHPTFSTFFICNLLSRSSRVVESPKFSSTFESLTLVSTSSGYKLLMLSSLGSSNTALVYDSGTHLWRQFEGNNQILYNQEGVFYKGLLYFITTDPFRIVSFDLESGSWGRSVIELPNELAFARLVSDGNRKLYLIGGIGSNGISKSMKLWELSGDGENWTEVERVPELMVRKFVSVCYHKYEHVYCFWHQGLLCVCCYTWPEILYYKVSRRTWHWLPKCPMLPEKWSCGFKWFSFVPQLYTFA